jgi:hypothetical protein
MNLLLKYPTVREPNLQYYYLLLLSLVHVTTKFGVSKPSELIGRKKTPAVSGRKKIRSAKAAGAPCTSTASGPPPYRIERTAANCRNKWIHRRYVVCTYDTTLCKEVSCGCLLFLML